MTSVVIGLTSNGDPDSSISDMLFLLQSPKPSPAGAPASASHGWLCGRRPRRPTLLPTMVRSYLYLPTPSVILQRRQPHPLAEPVPRTPLRQGLQCPLFLTPDRSHFRPRHRPSPWCSWRGVVNMVKERLPSEEDCTWRG